MYGYGEQVGIMMGDESYQPPSSNITIINNIAYGNNRNFYWWRGDQGGGLVNVLIANNSFVNSVGTSGVKFNRGDHQNSYFINNIIVQDGSLPIIDVVESDLEFHFSNNLWSKTPLADASGPNDIIGDPHFAEGGNPFTPEWFMLTNLSPAIGGAQSLPEIVLDYFKHIRDSFPDIGAIEFISAP
jgi:hypothetical protein